jgi:4-diphosphocytidyl-2C-methyl-D-erythritol kinase
MIEQDDKIGVIANTFNSFESQVWEEKTKLLGYGFNKVILSGSGSAFICFGDCSDEKIEVLKQNYKYVERVFIG